MCVPQLYVAISFDALHRFIIPDTSVLSSHMPSKHVGLQTFRTDTEILNFFTDIGLRSHTDTAVPLQRLRKKRVEKHNH